MRNGESAYQEVINDLARTASVRGIRYDLDHLYGFLQKLGNPHQQLHNIIHIAGTNGKGSTLTFIASALIHCGFSVGTYTSPHLFQYTERICLNFKPIFEQEFVVLYAMLKQYPDIQQLTEFEILTVLSFLYFIQKKPDFMIYEVGLGGRLDATNLVSPLLSIITRIDYDHQALLGDTLEKIAFEKAGIIKKEVPVLTFAQKKEVMAVLSRQAYLMSAPFIVVRPTPMNYARFQLKGAYQKYNYALAKKAIHLLLEKGFFSNINLDCVEKGFWEAFIPCRYQKIQFKNQTLILDAAHNPNGIDSLINTLKRDYPHQKFAFLMGIIQSKDMVCMIQKVLQVARVIYYCDFESGKSFSFQVICDTFPSAPIVSYFLKDPLPGEPLLVITGSIYFLGQLHQR